MNTYRKLSADAWGIQCDKEEQPGASVTVTTKAGKVKTVTLGERQNLLGFIYAIAQSPRASVSVGDLGGILALFDRAAKRLKFPAIELGVPGVMKRQAIERGESIYFANDYTIRVNVAGARASVPGSLTVLTSERGDDDRRGYLGRILRDGTFQPGRDCPPEVAPRLAAFAKEPAKIAGEQGRLTGRCCFCRIALTDSRSTAVGYGETCAGNYGLPWGEERSTFNAA